MRQRYSLRSVFLGMTALCVLAGVISKVLISGARQRDVVIRISQKGGKVEFFDRSEYQYWRRVASSLLGEESFGRISGVEIQGSPILATEVLRDARYLDVVDISIRDMDIDRSVMQAGQSHLNLV